MDKWIHEYIEQGFEEHGAEVRWRNNDAWTTSDKREMDSEWSRRLMSIKLKEYKRRYQPLVTALPVNAHEELE